MRLGVRRGLFLLVPILLGLSAGTARAQAVCGTPGKDGPGGTLTGVVNTYFPSATGTASAGATAVTVGAATGATTPIAPGDLLLVIQMQDAQYWTNNNTSFGANDGTGTGYTALNNSGRYEYVTATSALGTGGGTVSIRGTGAGNGLLYTYATAAATTSRGRRSFQVIRVPQYSTAAFSSGLTASFWDGNSGGILAVDVAGTLTLGGTVRVDGVGFRGGAGRQLTGASGGSANDYVSLAPATPPSGYHASKGEGIAGTPRFVYVQSTGTVLDVGEGYATSSGSYALGAPGNAGGGGTDPNPSVNDQNTGGGGGGNGGAGGTGGFAWSAGTDVGGRGGVAFPAALDRITFGGGGGAGDRNNSTGAASSGGAGGGIVLVRAGSVTGTGTITANGAQGVTPANDGGGGGGAGGSIVVLTQSGTLSGLSLQAHGADGTNADVGGAEHGPGGGGGGGVVFASSAAASTDVGAGSPGYAVTPGDNYGAVGGAAGSTNSNSPITASPGTSASPLCVPSLTVTKTTGTPTVVQTPTGTSATYTIVVSNLANRDTARAVALSDVLPANFTYASSVPPVLSGGASRPTTSNPAIGATTPAFSAFSIPGGGSVSQTFTVAITNTVTSGTFQNPATATYTDPARTIASGTTTSNYLPASSTGEDVTMTSADLTITKTHAGNFTVGSPGSYTITPSNAGTAPTTGTVTVLDTLPAGLTYSSASGTGWSCSNVAQVVTCTSTAAIAAGAAGQAITLTVDVLPAAAPTVTNAARVSGGGEPPATSGNNSATDPTTVGTSADVVTTKAGPATGVGGADVTYTITTLNQGPSPAAAVSITDTLPAGATFVAASAGGVFSAGVVTWPTIPSLASGSGANQTVTLRFASGGSYTNVAAAASATADPLPANNRSIAATVITESADLVVTKSGPASAAAGAPIAYTIVTTNAGPSTASNVTVTDTLPAGTTFLSASNGGAFAAGVVTWPVVPSLASGASVSYTVTITAVQGSSLVNIAAATSPTADASPANNRATASTTVSASADLATTKNGPASAAAGADITYTIMTVNNGPSDAASVVVTDTVPAGMTFVSASAGGTLAGSVVTWPVIGTLAAGGTQAYTVTLRGAAAGSYTNIAVSSASTPDANPANNRATAVTTIAAVADVVTTKTGPATASAGAPVSYVVTTHNNGPSDATGVIVSDTLPAGAVFTSASNGGTLNAGVVTWPAVTLANGATLAYSVMITAPGSGPITNIASSSATTTDPTPGNNDGSQPGARVVTAISQVADLITTKAGPATVDAGGALNYTIVTRNLGPSAAQSVVVTDQLPAGVTFVGASNGGAEAGTIVTWPMVASLAAGDSVAYTLTGTAPNTTSTITNIARSSSATADPVAANNDGSAGLSQVRTQVRLVDLSITKSHVGDFGTGTVATYTITVTNVSTAPTTGLVTVVDSLPTGLAYRAESGAGWSCAAAGQVVTCSNAAVLAPAATTSMALQVVVSNSAAANVTNIAAVSTPGDTASGGNNRATDATTINRINPLVIEKTASRTDVEIADVLDYTVLVRNLSASPIPDVELSDVLPKGFTYQHSTARADMVPLSDPAGAPGPNLVFALGTLAGNQTIRVTYRVRVGAGAALGDGTNRAIAQSATTQVQSALAAVTVRILGGVFTDRGYIVGKVYADCDCQADRRQSPEDLGIPGVRLFLEDGTSTVTDAEGKYNFYGVTPRSHVVKVDPTTLPAGGTLVILADRNLGDPGSRLVDLTNGELHAADFAVAFSPEVMGVIKARRERGEVFGAIMDSLAGTTRPMGIEDTLPPVGADRPVLPVAPDTTDSGATPGVAGVAYRPLGSITTSADEASGLPVTRLATLPGPDTVAPVGSIEITPAARTLPADGNTAIAVRVRILDRNRHPVTDDRSVTLETSLGRWLAEDLDPVEPGIQARITGGEGEFTLVAASAPGVGEIRATSNLLVATAQVVFVPAPRPLLASGLIEGRLDLRSLAKDGIVPVTSTDRFERELHDLQVTGDSGKLTAGVRSALFLRGKIKGSTLLTLAYDTERDPDRQMFRDIEPDAFYPVYGDASIKEYGAQSFDRLYVRLDHARTFALYGDYVTPNASPSGAQAARQLGAYNRSLTGTLAHVEGQRGLADVFASRDRLTQVVDEIPGRGISGPYQLSRTDGRVNSEQVELVTRDRNQPTRILKVVPLTRFTDYTIEAFTGRLLFFTPVPSADRDLDPVSIRVTYEVERASGTEFWVYGADGQLRLGDRVEAGGSAVRNEDPFNRTQLYSFNTSARVANGTFLTAEVARTDGDSAGTSGNAGRVELRHSSAGFSAQAWGIVTDSGFSNPSSTFQRGRAELGFRGSAAIDTKTRLLGEVLYSEDRIGGGHRTGGTLGAERRFGEWVRAELGYRYADETAQPASAGTADTPGATPNETNAIRTRLTFRVPGQPRASVFGEFEQDVKSTDQRRAALGGEYVIARRLRLYGQQEWISSGAGEYALNAAQQVATTVIGLDAGYTKDGQFFSEYRVRDAFAGREAEAAYGLRNRWHLARGLTANTSFERVDVIKGAGQGEATAITTAIEYTANPLWRATARLEYRFAPGGDNLLATLGYARKLSRDWTLLGRGLLNTFGDGGVRARNQLGLAWRETDHNRWNGLMSYENRFEKLSPGTDAATRNSSNIASANLSYAASRRLTVSAHYAGKWATDSSLGLRSTTNGQLGSFRGLYDLTDRWDAGIIGSVLWTDGFAHRQYGVGIELGRRLITNLRLAAGYNIFGFRNPDLAGEDATDRGFYVKFGFKFDENLFQQRATEGPR